MVWSMAARYADQFRAGGSRLRVGGRLSHHLHIVGVGGDHGHPDGAAEDRRPSADGRYLLFSDTRRFCKEHLGRLGIETTFYDPLLGADIATLMRPQHQSRLCRIARFADLRNAGHSRHRRSWRMRKARWSCSTTPGRQPLFFRPFEKGVDVSIQAATKFIVGHSDAMLGTITCATKDLWYTIKSSVALSGVCAGAEEAYLGLRGLRTLGARLRQHTRSRESDSHLGCNSSPTLRACSTPLCPAMRDMQSGNATSQAPAVSSPLS